MRFISSAGAVLLSFAASVSAIDFNPDDEASIKTVTSQYAYGLMSYYTNNATGLPKEEIGIFKKPHYWWEAGAAWGGMIEYTQLTGDESYVKTLTQALEANYGPKNDIILPWRRDQQGNDDQAFWAFAIMSALEYGFPEPENAPAKYIDVVTNAFENIVSRWNDTVCEGGLKWQIYPENAYGYNYRNSISNGAVFALGARLARYTGEQKYADWAIKLYDWSVKKNLVNNDFAVYDGTGEEDNCATVADKTEWTYNNAVYLHGAAVMFDYTKGDETWKTRTAGFLKHSGIFFKPYDNATDIMYERPCETGETGRKCNLDQQSFKAYLARFLAKTAILAPFTKDEITKYLKTSAVAAAKSCSGDGKNACGSKWYTGNWDGTSGVGQQLSALEVTQALLLLKGSVAPKKAGDAGDVKPAPSSTAAEPKSTDNKDAPAKTDAPKTTDKKPDTPAKTDAPSVTDKPKGDAPAPTTTGSPATSGKPAEFPEGPNCSEHTTTIYVSLLTSQPPIPEPSGGYSPPKGNDTATTTKPPPAEFTGAASGLKVTAFSAVVAVAVVFIGVF